VETASFGCGKIGGVFAENQEGAHLMKPNFNRANAFFGCVSAAALLLIISVPVRAQQDLPLPDYRFPGTIGRTEGDSDPARFPPVQRPKGAPNVVIILLDDVGFGQFSVSGGGVAAPRMEELAEHGLFFNRFHTTALCSPTRAALLTGRNEHNAGMGAITEMATAYDGYTSMIPKSAGTIGQVLNMNGYATAWIGKNHNTPVWETGPTGPFDRTPNGWGFEYFYGFNSGDSSQFEPVLVENHIPVPRSTDPNYHLTTDLTDHAIAWLRQENVIDPGRPYMLYYAPGATHSPHQPPKDWADKCKGQFDQGWDKYREETLVRQKKLGIVPADTDLTPRPHDLAAWDTLKPEQKHLYARMAELFCAFGEHADYEAGRLLDTVKSLPNSDNTLIFYIVGDNGASAEGHFDGTSNELGGFNGVDQTWEQVLPKIDELGGPKHYNHMPSAWAWAMNAPFQWTKQVASHFGGTRNPLIVSWPAHTKEHGLRSQFHHVTDIMPTILEATGLTMPRRINGIDQMPLDGISMMYAIDDANAKGRRRTQVFEQVVNRAIYRDGWMASSIAFLPWQSDRKGFDVDTVKWELYNIDKDFSQAHDLAAAQPEKLRQMEDLWWAEAAKSNILPLDWRGVERMSDAITGRPSPTEGRTSFTYLGPLSRLPESEAPDLKNKSFTLTADVDIPAGGAEGMLFTQGGITAGWGFYVKDNKLTFMHNFIDLARFRVTSTEALPTGKATLVAEFVYDGKPGEFAKGGTVTLKANGRVIGSGNIQRTTPIRYSLYEGQDVGADGGSPVDDVYKMPFAFTGKLNKLTVDLK
jgi:arylsulfatase A-like enzyme